MNERFQNALHGKAQAVPPIWMMRQAGRYHSHYQGLRAKHSFMELCKIPELAAETALGPIRDFDFDVSILFSDLLFPLEALGMGLEYTDAKGPQLGFHLNPENWSRLKSGEEALQGLMFQAEAVRATRELLPKDKSLIGFVGAPWTLFVYAVHGSHKGNLVESKGHRELFESFMGTLVPLLKRNIALQLDAGAELVMLFDTAAGELAPFAFNNLVRPHVQSLIDAFPKKLGYYMKGGTRDHFAGSGWLDEATPLAGLGFDHRFSLPNVLKETSKERSIFIQGNYDQNLLLTETDAFKASLESYLEEFAPLSQYERRGWVSGLGHGVLPKTPEKHIRFAVDRIREFFAKR
ncbi:MAG: uroporphyrinogen decarboxylase family protein [Bdellovibrionota bacterium]